MNKATLVVTGDDWYLWVQRPDAAPAAPHLLTRNSVGDAIGDHRLSDEGAVVGYVERCLNEVGYSTVRELGPTPDNFIAAWTLASRAELTLSVDHYANAFTLTSEHCFRMIQAPRRGPHSSTADH